MSVPDGYEGSRRPILHIVPSDGTEHEMVRCWCHPKIIEANAWHAEVGLEEAGVPEEDDLMLIFDHADASAGGSGVYEFRWELDEDDDPENYAAARPADPDRDGEARA